MVSLSNASACVLPGIEYDFISARYVSLVVDVVMNLIICITWYSLMKVSKLCFPDY